MDSQITIKIKNISKSFGGLKALENVSFSVKTGQIHALIGPNGAGKTTLMNIISGLETADSGEIIFNDKPINKLPPEKRTKIGIARTFQNLELFGEMTVLENVMVGMYLKYETGFIKSGLMLNSVRKVQKDIITKSLNILDYVGLNHRKNEYAKNLPVGEQRLLEIARAMAADPILMLLDEPAAGLNIRETKNLSILIKNLKEEKQITLLIVEHDMELIMGISDTITVLNFGKVIAEGDPLSIQKNPDVITAYLGEED
ncbi:MAG: ABC transporter ATP-binding protein [Thermodesulfovibrio sp.]|nr:ABC transporter ATP-binding protein [Thermodesulfovibrio sp.]